MTTSTQARQPAGVPVGGQFAATARPEPDVALPAAGRKVEVERLTALAAELGVDPTDVDDAVHEVTDQIASDMVNGSDDDIEDAQDRYYGEMDAHASSINNGGVPSQVEFLVDQLGPERTEAVLRECAAAAARNAALPRQRKPGR